MGEASNDSVFDEPLDFFPTLSPATNVDLKCNQYVKNNKTHIIYGGYEGIPENLLINFVGWILLLSLFTILRKRAWNYGRLALVQKYDNRVKLLGNSEYNVWTQLFYGGGDAELPKTPAPHTAPPAGLDADSIASYDFNLHLDKGTFSWITALFKIKDSHILHKSGRDAVHYLSFQRHIIVYMAVVCIVSITVILPINFQGTLEGGEKEFGHTTISNLSPSSSYMWVHISLAFLFLPLGIAFTRRYSRVLNINYATDLNASIIGPEPGMTPGTDELQVASSVTRTLMITRVPRKACHKDTLLRHFQEAYPEVEVTDLQFAYSIKELILFDKERQLAQRARIYCEAYEKETGTRLLMRPYKCGIVCCCCDMFGGAKVDALEYYSALERRLQQDVETEKVKALQHPTGIAFVTVNTPENAAKIISDHATVSSRCMGDRIPTSSVTAQLRPQNWGVARAPAPSNIYWKNLSVTNRNWWMKALLINLLLFLVLFFLTTPAVIINSLDFVFLTDKLEQMSPVLSEFFPTLLLWTMAALMPVMVAYSDQFMSHWTRSAENHSVMRKTFLFLLFMVVILPSLGLTSAKALVEVVTAPQENNATFRWECIFLPDNGAFFVNYIITSAFIGTSLELIRFPELFMYIIRLSLSRSEAEAASVRRAILYEFQFGVQYAWMLLIFAMTMIYSISCPLITPFGLLYMVFKHLVDKYNIYFAYGPSRISKNIHTTAVNFVMASIVLLQLCLLLFSIVRLGLNKPRSIYSLVLLSITLFVFVTHVALNWWKEISPIEYSKFDGIDEANSETSQVGDNGDDGISTPPTTSASHHPQHLHHLHVTPTTPDSQHGESFFFIPDVLRDGGGGDVNGGTGGAGGSGGGGSSNGPVEVGEDEHLFLGGGRNYGATPTAAGGGVESGGGGAGGHYQNYSSPLAAAGLA